MQEGVFGVLVSDGFSSKWSASDLPLLLLG